MSSIKNPPPHASQPLLRTKAYASFRQDQLRYSLSQKKILPSIIIQQLALLSDKRIRPPPFLTILLAYLYHGTFEHGMDRLAGLTIPIRDIHKTIALHCQRYDLTLSRR